MAAQDEINAQSRALTAAIAQNGSQGQIAFQAEQARRQAAQQAAVGSIANQSKMSGSAGNAPAAFTQQLQGQQAALGDVYAQDAAMSQASFNNSIAQTTAANQGYANAASAAVPVVQGQTAGIIAQIRERQQAEAADRAAAIEERKYQAEQRRLDAIEAEAEREIRKLEMELKREELVGTNGMSDEELETDQNNILDRAEGVYNAKTKQGVGDAIRNASQGSSLKGSMDLLRGKVVRVIGDDQRETFRELTPEELFDAQRYMYEFHNGDGTSATSYEEFKQQVAEDGGDPDRVPAYYTDAAKAQYENFVMTDERNRRSALPGFPSDDEWTPHNPRMAAIRRLQARQDNLRGQSGNRPQRVINPLERYRS